MGSQKAKKQGNKLLECVFACRVACIEKCVEYMNKYAYTFVGIYGYGFMTAGMKAMGLYPYAQGVVGTICFFLGFFVACIMNGIIDAANKAVFILYLENPHALENTHPDAHTKLTQAWKMIGHSERAEDVAADA